MGYQQKYVLRNVPLDGFISVQTSECSDRNQEGAVTHMASWPGKGEMYEAAAGIRQRVTL